MNRFILIGMVVGLSCAAVGTAQEDLPAVVEFNRDIRPILSDHCLACHGPDQKARKGKLRLDTEERALEERKGSAAVVAGKPDQSEILQRIAAEDEAKRMPPAKFGKRLTPRQTELVRRWIQQGAKWQKHWSLVPPQAPTLPTVGSDGIDAIDRFILARLAQEGLTLSPEADKRTLLRRLSFDLIGLPPTPQEMDTFLADPSPEAWQKQVERLLASKHFGERLALYWLDLVRYADTGGYHSDNHRDVWLYRDWVIQAFNDNMPFDRFTREQLAGDLLPNSTEAQRIASGYNRLLMTTEEGGAQPKEYAAKYAADRVRNASTVWLGLTLGCAECHDHKFDPFYTKEFYRFAAFFADIQEKPVGRQDQTRFPSAQQTAALRELEQQIAEQQKKLATATPELEAAQVHWEEALRLPEIRKLPKEALEAALAEPAKRTPAQKEALARHYRTVAPALQPARAQFAALQKHKAKVEAEMPTTLVSMSAAPRTMRVLPRGNWLDDSGEVVQPGVPSALLPLTPQGQRATRLDLANWLTAPDHPLTARVFVNRLWKLYFGEGLVKTLDDFGAQGAWPTHPELLDWLALEFTRSGWDVKHVIRQMVLSRTYRQSSLVSEALRQRDPYNRLLARQGRFRLDAELVRDNALAISGLLSHKVGGGPARPYQPAGYWALLNFPKREYAADKGEGLYRRSLYTYWCRTFPHPSFVAFDAPSREECTVERPRSNTPLQALVLLNDPIYVEAARVFAERVLQEGGKTTDDRLALAYRSALNRRPTAEETRVLTDLVARHLEHYRQDQDAAKAILKVGDRPAAADLEATELAAWTSVARVLLNLHETITRN